MATVHPSRMALVPQDPKEAYPSRDRQRSRTPPPRESRRRTPSRSQSGERRHGRGDRVEREDKRYKGRDRERDGMRERARADDYFDGGRGDDRRGRRSRSRSVDRERDREREDKRERDRPRRASPEYTEYRKPSPSRIQDSQARAPWRQEENMYPNRRDRPPHVGYGGGGTDFMDSRRLERDSKTANVWPSSPKAPTRSSRSPDPKRRKKSRKHRRDPSTELSSTDSEEERQRKERKERKRARKEKEKRQHRSRDRSPRKYSDGEDDRRDRRTRHRTRDRDEIEERDRRRDKDSRGPSRTKSPEPARPPSSDAEMDDEWVEKPSATTLLVPVSPTKTGPGSMAPPPLPVSGYMTRGQVADEDSDDEVGPQPLTKVTSSKKVDERQYGGALLRGEGSAMAAFLKDGTDLRIPRRGEIGLSSNEIESFESVGYVMSGSRHRRMNAVRMRKENQVISAEEKRGILKLQQEERQRRETILREEFQALVDEKLKAQGAGKS